MIEEYGASNVGCVAFVRQDFSYKLPSSTEPTGIYLEIYAHENRYFYKKQQEHEKRLPKVRRFQRGSLRTLVQTQIDKTAALTEHLVKCLPHSKDL